MNQENGVKLVEQLVGEDEWGILKEDWTRDILGPLHHHLYNRHMTLIWVYKSLSTIPVLLKTIKSTRAEVENYRFLYHECLSPDVPKDYPTRLGHALARAKEMFHEYGFEMHVGDKAGQIIIVNRDDWPISKGEGD